MLHNPPRTLSRKLEALEGFANGHPMLRCVWDRRKCCFVVQRQTRTFRRGLGYFPVLDIGPRLRAGGPTDIGSGDAVIRELRARDAYAQHDSFDKLWEKEFASRYRDKERKDAEDEDNFEVELVHDLEDAVRHRVTVPPREGHVKSFARD